MAIRIYTNGPYDNVTVKNLLYKSVMDASTMPYRDHPWILDGEDRLTLADPRWRHRASFRVRAYPGSGMTCFELIDPADTDPYRPYVDEETYSRYHDAMADLLHSHYGLLFYLLERTPWRGRGPMLDERFVRPSRRRFPGSCTGPF